ncbi:hypothetical protein EDC04DRAFT_2903467 [Pisolithus marmoratus]|nr:hypothetical protein EDC04DRAFT_2903467 [Pisolithus marmoratus]
MFAQADRKTSYKVPPTVVTDRLVSQEARRMRALEEQKRRRAQKYDSARNLDAFADLSLGPSDDEGDEDVADEPVIIREGIAGYASLAKEPADLQPPDGQEQHMEDIARPKKRNKNKRKRAKAKASKWADKCMYAELLEMKEEPSVWADGNGEPDDGLPSDIEQGWVAVAPVPIGKRCLAVTHQSASEPSSSSKHYSPFPPLGEDATCSFPLLTTTTDDLGLHSDTDWRKNGIVHVLDVIKWKGQDVADCETPFRFWWRDTRLAELPKFSPPSSIFHFSLANDQDQAQSAQKPGPYRFPYPTSFVPIPYHTDTTLQSLFSSIIPLARSTREISVEVPASAPFQPSSPAAMSVDTTYDPIEALSSKTVTSQIRSDGLLLYVTQASYEEGTSPLSCWVPIQPITGSSNQGVTSPNTSPLDLFQR